MARKKLARFVPVARKSSPHPYADLVLRGLRANAGQLVPPAARNARPGQTTLR
jgi:hypothetical protein